VVDPVAPYPGWIGSNTPGNQYGWFCIDYLKTATFGASYSGTEYHVPDDVPGKTTEQLVEAAYLSDKLYRLGGLSASTLLYQGPISFAIWQIMDPTPGHVPRDPAAQAYIAEAQNAYATGRATAAMYANTIVFVPDNHSIQDFLSLSPSVDTPEAGTGALLGGGVVLMALGLIRRKPKDNA